MEKVFFSTNNFLWDIVKLKTVAHISHLYDSVKTSFIVFLYGMGCQKFFSGTLKCSTYPQLRLRWRKIDWRLGGETRAMSAGRHGSRSQWNKLRLESPSPRSLLGNSDGREFLLSVLQGQTNNRDHCSCCRWLLVTYFKRYYALLIECLLILFDGENELLIGSFFGNLHNLKCL
jgi:hypothetical protein